MAFLTDLDNYVLFGSQYDEKVPFLEDYVLFDRPTDKDSYTLDLTNFLIATFRGIIYWQNKRIF